jgi:hypothetical protein
VAERSGAWREWGSLQRRVNAQVGRICKETQKNLYWLSKGGELDRVYPFSEFSMCLTQGKRQGRNW